MSPGSGLLISRIQTFFATGDKGISPQTMAIILKAYIEKVKQLIETYKEVDLTLVSSSLVFVYEGEREEDSSESKSPHFDSALLDYGRAAYVEGVSHEDFPDATDRERHTGVIKGMKVVLRLLQIRLEDVEKECKEASA